MGRVAEVGERIPSLLGREVGLGTESSPALLQSQLTATCDNKAQVGTLTSYAHDPICTQGALCSRTLLWRGQDLGSPPHPCCLLLWRLKATHDPIRASFLRLPLPATQQLVLFLLSFDKMTCSLSGESTFSAHVSQLGCSNLCFLGKGHFLEG